MTCLKKVAIRMAISDYKNRSLLLILFFNISITLFVTEFKLFIFLYSALTKTTKPSVPIELHKKIHF